MKKLLVILSFLTVGTNAASAMTLPEATGQTAMTWSVLTTPLTGTFMCIMAEFDHGTENYPLICAPTHVSIEASHRHHKETILAAKEDASMFLVEDGTSEKSALLQNAFDAINSIKGLQGMTDKEMAAAIIILSDIN